MAYLFISLANLVGNALIILSESEKREISFDKLSLYSDMVRQHFRNSEYTEISLIDETYQKDLEDNYKEFFDIIKDSTYKTFRLNKAVSLGELKETFQYPLYKHVYDALYSIEAKKVLLD